MSIMIDALPAATGLLTTDILLMKRGSGAATDKKIAGSELLPEYHAVTAGETINLATHTSDLICIASDVDAGALALTLTNASYLLPGRRLVFHNNGTLSTTYTVTLPDTQAVVVYAGEGFVLTFYGTTFFREGSSGWVGKINADIYNKSNTLNYDGTDVDGNAFKINYFGYNRGITRYRDFEIYDGRGVLCAKIDGGDKSLNVVGDISTVPLTFVAATTTNTDGIATLDALTGWYYKKQGKTVHLWYTVSGASELTGPTKNSFYITLPYTAQTLNFPQTGISSNIIDNSLGVPSVGVCWADGVTLKVSVGSFNAATDGWNDTGNKAASGYICYEATT